MTRNLLRPHQKSLTGALLASGLAIALSACTAPTGLAVVGTVDDSLVTVAVPALGSVSVDPDAGFAPDLLSATTRGSAPRISPVTALTGLGTFQRVSTRVEEGSRVRSGEVIATVDDTQLAAQVAVAQADAELAKAQPAVLQSAIDETYDKADEIADKRQEVEDGLDTLAANRAKLLKTQRELLSTRKQLITTRGQLLTSRAQLLAQREPVLEQRATLAAQRATLVAQRATLEAQRTALLKQRAELTHQLCELQKALDHLPPDPMPSPLTLSSGGTPPPSREEILATIAQLEAAIAQIDAGLPPIDAGLAQIDAGLAPMDAALVQIDAGLAQMNAGLTQMDTGLKKIDTGLTQIDTGRSKITTGLAKISQAQSKAREGLRKLDKAADKLVDVRRTLRNNKKLAQIAADTAAVKVQLARQQHSLTRVTAPVDGVVVSAAAAGDLLAPGATLVTIREDSPATVTAWLSPAELGQTCLGDAVRIHGDWMADGASLPATITRIGERSDYPPSSHATDEVHLTRAVPVEFTTSAGELPAGVPVEITISGCREVART